MVMMVTMPLYARSSKAGFMSGSTRRPIAFSPDSAVTSTATTKWEYMLSWGRSS